MSGRPIFILGPGRSGTSLLMSLLNKMGVATVVGEETITGEQNPEGDYEDRELVAVHKELLREIGAHPYLPVASDFLDGVDVGRYLKKISPIVESRLTGVQRWAFKDPMTASLLPLWVRYFNSAKIPPIYVLVIRNPAASVVSMHRQYNDSYELAELVWLLRVCDSLFHTGGNCFIVHYEDLFLESAQDVLAGLHEYIYQGGSRSFDANDLRRGIKSSLNRAQYDNYQIKNPLLQQLYSVLLESRGADFDRAELMRVVMNCRAQMVAFYGWADLAKDLYRKLNNQRGRPVLRGERKFDGPNSEPIAQLIAENRACHKQLLACREEVQSFRVKLSSLRKGNEKAEQENLRAINEKLRRKLYGLKASTSYRLSALMVAAVKKPGMSTVLLPWRMAKLAFLAFMAKK